MQIIRGFTAKKGNLWTQLFSRLRRHRALKSKGGLQLMRFVLNDHQTGGTKINAQSLKNSIRPEVLRGMRPMLPEDDPAGNVILVVKGRAAQGDTGKRGESQGPPPQPGLCRFRW